MAANDPSPGVATPTGVLQGVAAFSWDGSVWQPSGRAGPSVATPTGVLQGVAPFSWSGSWTPAGRAQPGVATPSGVLDGVAVYTWSGSAWMPTGGQPTTSTPTGTLRGVAVFNWDGSVWQPSGRAGPDVVTPYGVLQGVALFNWTGSVWAAASVHQNLMQFSSAIGTPPWTILTNTGVTAVVTANAATAPDGTLTASRIVFDAVSAAGTSSFMYQGFAATAAAYTHSVYLRGNAGGEQLYLGTSGPPYTSAPRITLTTQWQRFTYTTPVLTATTWYFELGTDLRDATQTATPAQTIFCWGAQVELGGSATSYVPT